MKREEKEDEKEEEKGCCESVCDNPLRIIRSDHLNSVGG